ncbi:WAPL protein, partial [Polypterus senegalus]
MMTIVEKVKLLDMLTEGRTFAAVAIGPILQQGRRCHDHLQAALRPEKEAAAATADHNVFAASQKRVSSYYYGYTFGNRGRGAPGNVREYERNVTMTSRFGKTYSRKGGNSNSKFDEVLSNKRATLSTKWGETTFKAQLGSKRPNFKPEIAEIPKRPKYQEDETSEDPFGFDSDEDSKPVSSRNVSQTKSTPVKQATEILKSENFTSVLETNSVINQPIPAEAVFPSRISSFDAVVHGLQERSTHKSAEGGNTRVYSSLTPAGLSDIPKF